MNKFELMDKARQDSIDYLKELEDKINNSKPWETFLEKLNAILKEDYYFGDKPKVKCIISGYEDNNIRFYSFEFINKKFQDLFRYEVSNKGIETKDLFSNGMVSFRSNVNKEITEYNKAKRDLIKYFDRITRDFHTQDSKLYVEYHKINNIYRERKKDIVDDISKVFTSKEFEDKVMKKINNYFIISKEIKIEFSASICHDITDYDYGERIEQYKINFYIGNYGLYKVLPLGSFLFKVNNINKTMKFTPGIIDNQNVINKDLSKGISYLRTTLKKSLKKIILDVL